MSAPTPPPPHRESIFLDSGKERQGSKIASILRKESVGGLLLVAMAALAVVWANSPWSDSYFALRDLRVGYGALELSLGGWASDGLLAIFFFLVGLELKREFVTGDLRQVRTAILPIAAAVGGVAAPALIYLAIAGNVDELRDGWAIPTATDIAFAVAVLALIGSHLPGPLRIFLLTLAVIDDLIAIGIIAIFYTESIESTPLLLAFATIVLYGLITQFYRRFFKSRASAAWLILLPLGAVAWALMHASGIHATIAGVLLGFTIPVLGPKSQRADDAGPGLTELFEHRFQPLSAGLAVPVFAFFSAGVSLGGINGLTTAVRDPLTIAIIAALVLGKPIGILATTWAFTAIARIRVDPALKWADLAGISLLAGIGFTVSLLIAELSFEPGSTLHDHAKVAILAASLIAAGGGALLLSIRNRHYRNLQ